MSAVCQYSGHIHIPSKLFWKSDASCYTFVELICTTGCLLLGVIIIYKCKVMILSLTVQVAFVPTGSAALVAPANLYDPRNTELLALLDKDTSFPTGPFAETQQVC